MPSGLLAFALLASSPMLSDETVSFNRDIRPILSENCYACHGPDQNQRKADLRFDLRENALTSGAIVPGEPENSELMTRILSTDRDSIMPPPHANKKLTDKQKQLLKTWIIQGAKYQGHWAYEKPVATPVPTRTNMVDYFVRERLKSAGLSPSKEADRRTLARRLSFDLTGLPPRPETVDAFLADGRPDAYERLVDSLLARPQYGERMAVTWLDVVRFADTIGYHSDNPRNVWPYRDYVIRSFNDNKRFNTFTIEQLAGDLLPNPTQDQKIGSCFNRLLLTTEEGGAQPKDYEARMLADRVRAVGTVWLGQTLGCCQCHDHKFDPFTQKEFYSLGSFFADIQEPIIGSPEPGMPVVDQAQGEKLAKLKSDMSAAKRVGPATGNIPYALAQKAYQNYENGLTKCIVSNSTANLRTVRLLPRGNWQIETGPIVTPTFPVSLPSDRAKSDKRLTRLDLANWLMSPDNPLPARVFVNRLWKQYFGIGLSKTLEDFGSQGEWPSHPELLDALAIEFVKSGWDVKHMVRLIVTSQTYRQSSVPSKEQLERDPDNRLLSRQSRFRVDAEFVRDGALSISGLLVEKIGGPSVKPYQPDGYWENLNFPVRQYVPDQGESQYRRGMYTWWQRTFPHPSMLAFDAPTREECAADRPKSNIPQQALVLLNDPSYVEAARALALRMMQSSPDTRERIVVAYRRALQRLPNESEMKTLTSLVEKHRQEFAKDRAAAEAVLKVGFQPVPKEIDRVELAAWTNVARVILNLHETLTRN
ncbi:MAG: PSD1 and planctomycete cytochrome C domain-containing protein [Gemmataceae bacterium]